MPAIPHLIGSRRRSFTASSRLWVEPIAAKLGIDDVIATSSIKGLDDYISHKVDGDMELAALQTILSGSFDPLSN